MNCVMFSIKKLLDDPDTCSARLKQMSWLKVLTCEFIGFYFASRLKSFCSFSSTEFTCYRAPILFCLASILIIKLGESVRIALMAAAVLY